MLVELSDGRVMANIRTESKVARRLVSISPDGATKWSPARFDEALFEPICMASLLRIGDQGQLLFTNPDSSNTKKRGWAYPRHNLTLRVSLDNGQTWPEAHVLEPGEAGYSDLAQLPDRHILCFYESGTIRRDGVGTMTQSLTLARFKIDDLRVSYPSGVNQE